MNSDTENFEELVTVLEEDSAPPDDLGGDGVEDQAANTTDPTALPEHDDSPEALQELLDAEAAVDVTIEAADIPEVLWADDKAQPDFAHTHTPAADTLAPKSTFGFDARVFDLLIRANHFRPKGKGGLIAFGLRGGKLVGAGKQEDVDAVQIEDTRPDHKNFQCTLGIFDTNTRKIKAYTGSTVPNRQWMRNYYKQKHGIQPHKSTKCNLLPTGCYIYRVNAHSAGKIKPALRMTNPDNLTADAKCTVLRTHQDLSFSHDDFWDPTMPFDNIHCAYSDNNFSSAGCQTIKGVNKEGPWGAFQDVIGALGWDARIDYVLLTAREAALAAAILEAGKEGDDALVRATLGRLRVGSEGEVVTALQKKLGFNGSAYFGPSTKKRLVEAEAAKGLASDGIYAPADDLATGWGVFGASGTITAGADDASGDEVGASTLPTAEEIELRLSGPVQGTAAVREVARRDAVSFLSKAGSDQMSLSTSASLVVGGAEVPLKINAEIDGVPAATSGLAIEVTVAVVPTGAAAEDQGLATPDVVTGGQDGKLTAVTFDSFAPRARAGYRDAIINGGHNVLGPHGIDANPRRLAHFLSQLSHESGGFSHRVESLNYTSAQRIRKIWPSRFANDAAAEPFVRNEPALAEKVYGGRMGNDTPGDGFKYRGRGLIQLTGRSAYQEYSDKLGVDLVGSPDLAFAPKIALRIAAEYWAHRKLKGERGMNALADDDKLRALTYRINGGTTNLAHREEELAKAKAIWGDDGSVSPSKFVERGDFNDQVRHLQLALISTGRLRGTVDGKFGFNTYKALFKFKKNAGMDGAGYADAATFQALNEVDFTEFAVTEDEAMIPMIGDEPEPVRNGVSQGEDDLVS